MVGPIRLHQKQSAPGSAKNNHETSFLSVNAVKVADNLVTADRLMTFRNEKSDADHEEAAGNNPLVGHEMSAVRASPNCVRKLAFAG
jgi:hypothetical protein